MIDFKIALLALVDNLKIGGSEYEKEYGGFSTRLKLPNNLKFISNNQLVTPAQNSIQAGLWMDFSGSFQSDNKPISGIAIFCHPQNPGFPEQWILRQKESLQNVAFPEWHPAVISKSKELVLRYRLVIHRDGIQPIDIENLFQNYIKENLQ